MKKIIITFIFSLVILLAKAQNDSTTLLSEKNQKYHALGFNAGFSTGIGLSYRYQHYKHSYQFTIFPFIAKEVFDFNVGGRYAYNFRALNKNRFFGYIGQSAGNTIDNYGDNSLRLVTGAGFGIEKDLTKNLSLNFGAGYAYYYYNNFGSGYAISFFNLDNNKLALTAELGLFYKLN